MRRTRVLAQGVYGFEIPNSSHNQLRPRCVRGKALAARKAPPDLTKFCAAEAVGGPPLGACTARDPRLEVAARRMRWLHPLASQVGLVGTVHRASWPVLWTRPGLNHHQRLPQRYRSLDAR